ncbi:hypothetical protein KC345_g11829, partial [Hortaea werneckii]
LMICDRSGINQKEVAAAAAKDQPTTARIVELLLKKGFIRKSMNPNDRRAFQLYATEEGRTLIGNTLELEQQTINAAVAGLNPEQLEELQGTLNASSVQVSLVTSLFALSAIASRLFSAKAMEKGGRNLLIFLGLAVSLAAVAGYYFAGSIAVMLLLRMLFGIGFGMASTAFPTMASDVIPIRRMGEGMGYFGLSTSLAMSAGPLIGLSLLQGPGFGSLLLCTAAALALIFPLGFSLAKSLPAQHKEPASLSAAEGSGA